MLVRISVLNAPPDDAVAGAVLNDRAARAHAGRRTPARLESREAM
jgi:hypothetical protein